MGNLGMPELILIMVLALLLFGPKKLPEMGKQVGKALGEFKRASNDLKRSIEDEVEKATREEPAKDGPPPPDPAPIPGTLVHGSSGSGDPARTDGSAPGPGTAHQADSSQKPA